MQSTYDDVARMTPVGNLASILSVSQATNQGEPTNIKIKYKLTN